MGLPPYERVRFKLMCELAQVDHFESLAQHG